MDVNERRVAWRTKNDGTDFVARAHRIGNSFVALKRKRKQLTFDNASQFTNLNEKAITFEDSSKIKIKRKWIILFCFKYDGYGLTSRVYHARY
ncbi:hypothetical protein EUGRSUZ_C02643 [Eucalyptus grandis]|uniref:Uncharacterized protein n=2 Tax=Eucalyptus grandis TaxID=71139 RepID=A0ACC3LG77_EUCGR|nr:hypothetical protein EUGRSUZ_C02643 [Eucalyptus grandis]